MRLLAVIVLELAVLSAAFTLWPVATAVTLELAGIVAVARLGWLMHTYNEREADPFD